MCNLDDGREQFFSVSSFKFQGNFRAAVRSNSTERKDREGENSTPKKNDKGEDGTTKVRQDRNRRHTSRKNEKGATRRKDKN